MYLRQKQKFHPDSNTVTTSLNVFKIDTMFPVALVRENLLFKWYITEILIYV